MNKWKKVEPQPKPEPEKNWRFGLPGSNYVSVYETEDYRHEPCWAMYVHVSRFAYADTLPDQPAPFAEALAHAAAVLEEHLEIVRAALREMQLPDDEGPVDFPAAVDPVAAIERKGDSR